MRVWESVDAVASASCAAARVGVLDVGDVNGTMSR
jgi:hypothetical protein